MSGEKKKSERKIVKIDLGNTIPKPPTSLNPEKNKKK
jgi:hypothetical protein